MGLWGGVVFAALMVCLVGWTTAQSPSLEACPYRGPPCNVAYSNGTSFFNFPCFYGGVCDDTVPGTCQGGVKVSLTYCSNIKIPILRDACAGWSVLTGWRNFTKCNCVLGPMFIAYNDQGPRLYFCDGPDTREERNRNPSGRIDVTTCNPDTPPEEETTDPDSGGSSGTGTVDGNGGNNGNTGTDGNGATDGNDGTNGNGGNSGSVGTSGDSATVDDGGTSGSSGNSGTGTSSGGTSGTGATSGSSGNSGNSGNGGTGNNGADGNSGTGGNGGSGAATGNGGTGNTGGGTVDRNNNNNNGNNNGQNSNHGGAEDDEYWLDRCRRLLGEDYLDRRDRGLPYGRRQPDSKGLVVPDRSYELPPIYWGPNSNSSVPWSHPPSHQRRPDPPKPTKPEIRVMEDRSYVLPPVNWGNFTLWSQQRYQGNYDDRHRSSNNRDRRVQMPERDRMEDRSYVLPHGVRVPDQREAARPAPRWSRGNRPWYRVY